MENYNEQLEMLKTYASFYDAIGDYNSADECTDIMIKISSMQNQNIKTAFLKGLERKFRKTFVDPIKKLGKGIDKFVRKSIPGGWFTVITAAVAMGAFGSQHAKFVKNFFRPANPNIPGSGGGLDQLMNSGALGKSLGTTLINVGAKQVAKMGAGGASGGGGGTAQQTGDVNWGMKWDAGAQTTPSTSAQITSPQGLIYNFTQNSIQKLSTAKNQNEAQGIFTRIKNTDAPKLKQDIINMVGKNNPNPAELNLINPTLETIKSQVRTTKGWILQ